MTALGGFLRADALSALVIGLTAFVGLACSIYAVGYFRRDQQEGRITEAQLRHYYVLTPLFVFAMLLAPMADNLGVMWVAIESTTLASVLLVTFYNQKTSFEAGWKYIIIGSVGISLALFGTVITYSSAVGVLGDACRAGDELVGAGRDRGQIQPHRHAPGLRAGAAGLRHQGGPRPHAHVETGRLRRSARAGRHPAGRGLHQLRDLQHHAF